MKQNLLLTKLLATAFFSFGISSAMAQENQQKTEKEAPIQISFITPVGTNGTSSKITYNNISINMLFGINGGLKAAEFGGLINGINGNVHGAQFAGLGNYVCRDVSGAQFAGLANINKGTLNGCQFGGLANLSHGNAYGAQFAGLINTSSSFKGFQSSGLINIVNGDLDGTQTSGIINYAKGGVRTGQISGLINISGGTQGKLQLAGLVNIASGNTKGAQISGLVNYSHTLNGVQIGLINITDSIENGVTIGLINYAKNGYLSIGAFTDETFRAGISLRTGLKKLYSIVQIGYTNNPYWGIGFGLGSYLVNGNKISLTLEGLSFQINEDEWWTDKTNMLVRMNLNFEYHLSSRMSIVAGISDNMAISRLRNAEGLLSGGSFIPGMTFFDHTGKRTKTVMYPGISFGFQYQIR